MYIKQEGPKSPQGRSPEEKVKGHSGDITQWRTLVELCHEIITVTSIHIVRPCCTGHLS